VHSACGLLQKLRGAVPQLLLGLRNVCFDLGENLFAGRSHEFLAMLLQALFDLANPATAEILADTQM
jgi:hypothetical protein